MHNPAEGTETGKVTVKALDEYKVPQIPLFAGGGK